MVVAGLRAAKRCDESRGLASSIETSRATVSHDAPPPTSRGWIGGGHTELKAVRIHRAPAPLGGHIRAPHARAGGCRRGNDEDWRHDDGPGTAGARRSGARACGAAQAAARVALARGALALALPVQLGLPAALEPALARLYPPTEHKLFGVLPFTSTRPDPRQERRRAQTTTLAWLAAASWVGLLLLARLPAAVAAAQHEARRREQEGDACLVSEPEQSHRHYQVALGLVTDRGRELALREKLSALSASSRRPDERVRRRSAWIRTPRSARVWYRRTPSGSAGATSSRKSSAGAAWGSCTAP
jgi:hypothetical protein